MEADWSVEAGTSLPSIDVPWEGFVDLRRRPQAIAAVSEAAWHPALGEAIRCLNASASPLFTVKCDAWTLPASEIDPDEFGACRDEAREGFASYIDMLQLDPRSFRSFDFHERWVKALTGRLRKIVLRNGRVDSVVRNAAHGSQLGFGVTLYAAGCGVDAQAAYAAWKAVLLSAVAATITVDFLPFRTGE